MASIYLFMNLLTRSMAAKETPQSKVELHLQQWWILLIKILRNAWNNPMFNWEIKISKMLTSLQLRRYSSRRKGQVSVNPPFRARRRPSLTTLLSVVQTTFLIPQLQQKTISTRRPRQRECKQVLISWRYSKLITLRSNTIMALVVVLKLTITLRHFIKITSDHQSIKVLIQRPWLLQEIESRNWSRITLISEVLLSLSKVNQFNQQLILSTILLMLNHLQKHLIFSIMLVLSNTKVSMFSMEVQLLNQEAVSLHQTMPQPTNGFSQPLLNE